MPKRTDRKETPKYREIAGALRAAIERGDYQPGQRIPGENKLMEEHGVSRTTARDALAVLRDEGLTDTRRGSGVFVREFKLIRRNAAERLSRNVWGVGRAIWEADTEDRPRREAVDVAEIEAPDRIAATFGMAPGSRVCCRSRVHRVEGRPTQLSTSYLPADLVAGSPITQPDTGPGGIYARLADLGHAPERFREEIRVRMPLADERSTLDLSAGIPVILIARTAFDAEGAPVEVNEMLLDASSYILEYDFTS